MLYMSQESRVKRSLFKRTDRVHVDYYKDQLSEQEQI